MFQEFVICYTIFSVRKMAFCQEKRFVRELFSLCIFFFISVVYNSNFENELNFERMKMFSVINSCKNVCPFAKNFKTQKSFFVLAVVYFFGLTCRS